MLYKTILAVTFAASALAAPLERSYDDDATQVYSSDEVEPTETAPVAQYTTGSCECVDKPGTSSNPTDPSQRRFFPSDISHYDVSTGAIECSANTGLVDKFYTNKGHDRTTLLTFTYPEAAKGRMCQFKFSLPESARVYGSKKIDVYSSLAPAPGCKKSWPPGNQRDRHLGRLSVERGEFGTWQSTYLSYLTNPTPCKAPNTVEGFELVGVNDQDHVYWGDIESYGAQIVYS